MAGVATIGLSMLVMSLPTVLFLLIPSSIASLYIQDQAVIAIATTLLFFAGFFQLADAMQLAGISLLRSLNDVLRNGKRKDLKVEIGELQDEESAVAARDTGGPDAFGLRVQKVTPEIADQLGLDSTEGVVVTSVELGSPAAESGLQRGDVILEVKSPGAKPVPVEDPDQLEHVLASVDAKALLLVRRGGNTQFLPLKRK